MKNLTNEKIDLDGNTGGPDMIKAAVYTEAYEDSMMQRIINDLTKQVDQSKLLILTSALVKKGFELDSVTKLKQLEKRIIPDKTWELYYVNQGEKLTFIVGFKVVDSSNWKMEPNKISVDVQYSEIEQIYERED